MFGRPGDIETRLDKLEAAMTQLTAEAHAARANFLMSVNQMGKFKEAIDTHTHTMVDDAGKGTTRPQGEVINIVHELVQVLEQESNHLRVDINAGREATASLNQRLADLEASVLRLCKAMQASFDPTTVFGTKPDS